MAKTARVRVNTRPPRICSYRSCCFDAVLTPSQTQGRICSEDGERSEIVGLGLVEVVDSEDSEIIDREYLSEDDESTTTAAKTTASKSAGATGSSSKTAAGKTSSGKPARSSSTTKSTGGTKSTKTAAGATKSASGTRSTTSPSTTAAALPTPFRLPTPLLHQRQLLQRTRLILQRGRPILPQTSPQRRQRRTWAPKPSSLQTDPRFPSLRSSDSNC